MLEGESKIYKHDKARTLYLTIPSSLACDSQFDMKAGDTVKLEYVIAEGKLIIRKVMKE